MPFPLRYIHDKKNIRYIHSTNCTPPLQWHSHDHLPNAHTAHRHSTRRRQAEMPAAMPAANVILIGG